MATMKSHDKVTADYTVNFSELVEALDILSIQAREPVMVWGGPGVGKSEAARTLAKRHNMELIDIRPAMMDPVELRGLQYIDQKRTANAIPDFLPATDSTGRYLLVLEELVSAMPSMQVAMYQLVLDRRIGEYRLPPGAIVIGCGNREQDRGVVYRMPTPLASRFASHLELSPDVNEWKNWAIKAGIAPEVVFWMEYRPDALYDFDPRRKEPGFPCPRTWEFVSKFVQSRNGHSLSPGLELKILRGCIGEEHAIEFAGWLRMWRECPHPQTIIDNPDGARIPTKVDVQMALCGALYRIANTENLESIIRFAKRLRPEMGEFLVGSCVRANEDLQHTRAFIAHWATVNGPN